ncbi:MAG: transporter [Bacteroidia bacterium]|nr:transporter [Bacteroidia bacterium]
MYKYVVSLALLLTSYAVSAQTIITDRPDQTESSLTIGRGELQIETGILYGTAKDDFFSEELVLAPTVLWRYGITKGIELRLLTEIASVKDKLTSYKTSGISDLQLGTKIQILKKQDIKTDIAFVSHVIIPTAKDALTLNEIGTINKLSIAHDIGETFGLGYNVGYDYFGFGSGNLTYSLSLGIGISEKVGMYIEPFGALVKLDNHEASFDAGITYLVKDNPN